MITKEEFQQWKQQRVTKYLYSAIEDAINDIYHKSYSGLTADEIVIAASNRDGQVESLQEVISLIDEMGAYDAD